MLGLFTSGAGGPFDAAAVLLVAEASEELASMWLMLRWESDISMFWHARRQVAESA